MTRGYFAIIGKNKKVKECGSLCNSAYPSYYGLQILDAIEAGSESTFIQSLRAEDSEELNVETISMDWFVHQPGDKETSRYAFPEYSYLLQSSSGILSIYNYGKLLFRIRREDIPLYRFIFEKKDALERALSIDPETNIEARDGKSELKRLINSRPSLALLENIIASAPAVSLQKKSELRKVMEPFMFDRYFLSCDLQVVGPEITNDWELDWSKPQCRYNISLEFRPDAGNEGAYYTILRATNTFRADVPHTVVRPHTRLSLTKAHAQAAEYVKAHQDDIVRLSVADRYFAYAQDALKSNSKTRAEAIASANKAIEGIHALCKGYASGIGDFESVICSALECSIYELRGKEG